MQISDAFLQKKILSESINSGDDSSYYLFTLFIVITLNLIITIANLISAHVLKNKEKKIFSFTLKEKNRIKHFETIYQRFETLSNLQPHDSNDCSKLIEKTNELRKFCLNHKLYFKSKENKLFDEFIDYFTILINKPKSKSYEEETKFFNKLYNEFNK